MKRVAILASGAGSNAENIVHYFRDDDRIEFAVILSNKKEAYVHERAAKLGIPSCTISKAGFESGEALQVLKDYRVDFIVLAGFLLKVPDNILKEYPDRILNIHPALLPKYGGKGMYGAHVHEAVVAAKESESGITIHYVNEHYDEGEIIFQARCQVLPTDTPDDVATKVHVLEYEHFPKVIAQIINH